MYEFVDFKLYYLSLSYFYDAHFLSGKSFLPSEYFSATL